MQEIGPVDYAILGFPGNRFRGEIGPALADLVESGTIRIIDIAFAGKSGEGDVVAFELSELEQDVREGLERIGLEVGGLFNADDVVAAAERLDPNSSVALIAWENVWASRLERTVRDAGGTVLDLARLPHVVVQEARDWALAQA